MQRYLTFSIHILRFATKEPLLGTPNPGVLAAGVVRGGGAIHTDCEPNRNVEAMRLMLSEQGIESRPLWKPMHKQPVYKDATAYVNGTSEAIFKQGICLPSGPMVTDADVAFIIETVKKSILI